MRVILNGAIILDMNAPPESEGSSHSDPGLRIYYRHAPHWRLEGSAYFITWCLLKGAPELTPAERSAVVYVLKHFDGQRFRLYAYVVMNDHVHVVLQPLPGFELNKIIHTWKSYSANALQRSFGRIGSVWQAEWIDHIIRDEDDLYVRCNYILQNPLRRWGAEEYAWMGWKWEHLPS